MINYNEWQAKEILENYQKKCHNDSAIGIIEHTKSMKQLTEMRFRNTLQALLMMTSASSSEETWISNNAKSFAEVYTKCETLTELSAILGI